MNSIATFMSTAALVPPTGAALEAAMEALLDDPPAEAAATTHDNNVSEESPSKRPRKVRQLMTKASQAFHTPLTRAVEVSHTTGSKPPGAVLPGARPLAKAMTDRAAKTAGVVRQVAAESCRLLTCAALRCAALRCIALHSLRSARETRGT